MKVLQVTGRSCLPLHRWCSSPLRHQRGQFARKMTPNHQCESGGEEIEVIDKVAEEVKSVEVEQVLEIESPEIESVEVERALGTVESVGS